MNSTSRSLAVIIVLLFEMLLLALINLGYHQAYSQAFHYGVLGQSVLLSSSLILGLTIAAVLSVRFVVGEVEKETKAQAELVHLKNLEELMNVMRSQRHNFNHLCQTLYGLMEVGAWEEAQKMLEQELEEVAVTSQLVRTGHPAVSALLQKKLGIAQAQGISTEVEAKADLAQLPLRATEVAGVLGNLLDNAIEASLALPREERAVRVELGKKGNRYILQVANRYHALDNQVMARMFDSDFSTKGAGRGIGLYNVRSIVGRYGGQVHPAYREGWVVMTVELPRKAEAGEAQR